LSASNVDNKTHSTSWYWKYQSII